MAEPTSAAPLPMMRKTTSRKPRNAATISEIDMTCLPSGAARVEDGDYDRGAQSSISNLH
ncbi:MAG TPA: hypothetical protein VN637_09425 [Roseiarcus sp.]|jgi:hypothetical protein|nr:hypothetical protein [Roseiarcus sp.]